MTDTLGKAIAISVAIHVLAFLMVQDSRQTASGARTTTHVDLASLDVVQFVPEAGLGVGALTSAQVQAMRTAQKRRQIYQRYIEEVSLAIHARRLDFGHRDLIGLASFRFVIDANGLFGDIELVNSSGNAVLDDVARRAIAAASGKVKRPRELGNEPLTMFEEVRFQYNLN